jgi:carboxyl-terminal processing protease
MLSWAKRGLRVKTLIKLILVVVVVLTLTSAAFGAGVVLGHSDLLSRLGVAPLLAGPARAEGDPTDFHIFWQAWAIVHDHFVDRQALDATNLEYGAIRGMVAALGDDGHTVFLTPEELASRQADLSGKFSGIGAQLGVKDGLPVIVAPFDGSPAAQAGVKAGDIIMKVDGQDVTTWPLDQVASHIRGEAGTQVVLTLLRPAESKSLEITITRGEIVVPAVTWTMVPGTEVALIRLSQFSANATEELVTSLKEAKAAGAASLILDLRNNPGGLLDQAVQVASQFLKDGDVLLQEDAQGQRKAYPVEPRGVATDVPMVVLINQGSASAAEILAGAIQDHRRGTLVGETTFGTGTVLESFTLDDGSTLLVGTSQWLTPNGRLIRKQGIEPDVRVELPIEADLLSPNDVEHLTASELLQSQDAQFLKALELLQALPDNTASLSVP